MNTNVCNVGFHYKMQARRIKPRLKNLWELSLKSGKSSDFADEDFLVFDEWEMMNVMPTLAQNYMLGAAFTGVSPVSTWYVGLHSSAYTCLVGDTFATFLASATEITNYSGAPNRVGYTPDAVSGGILTNTSSPTIFTFTNSVTVNGGFITNTVTQGSSAGYLISAVRTPSAKTFANTEQLKVVGGITLTSV